MGCSSCRSSPSQKSELIDRIKDALDRDDPSSLPHLFNLLTFAEKLDLSLLINKPLIHLKSLKLNILSYSLLSGHSKCFEYILSKSKSSLEIMEDLLSCQKISAISVVCEKGHIEILKIYLPHYLKSFDPRNLHKEQTMTISLSNNPRFQESPDTHPYTPVQLACVHGQLSIVKYLNDYFEIKYPPYTLDVHSVDEVTGENCALLTVRTGNFVMIKYLNEILKADFKIKNIKQEGALQVLAAASKLEYSLQYLECAMYLVEIVKIDILYMYEETLLLLENKLIVKYIEERLKNLGVVVTKRDLEKLNKVTSYKTLVEKEERDAITGDTQEISGITQNSNISNFAASFNFN